MPSAPTKITTVDKQSQEKSYGSSFLSTPPQFVADKIVRSKKPAGSVQIEILNNLDEVIFLRLPGVKAVTGLSKSSLYALIREKSFPEPVRLGARTVAWVRSEVRQWAIERVRASR